jgi:hypothetical protein
LLHHVHSFFRYQIICFLKFLLCIQNMLSWIMSAQVSLHNSVYQTSKLGLHALWLGLILTDGLGLPLSMAFQVWTFFCEVDVACVVNKVMFFLYKTSVLWISRSKMNYHSIIQSQIQKKKYF